MPNRRLTPDEIASLNELQARTVADLDGLAGQDPELLFAFRRRLFTRLMHIERGTPAHRAKLKAEKWNAQGGICPICELPMPQKGSELDRTIAWKGYTPQNTRLLHHDCHVEDQRRKGFSDAEAEIVERIEELETIAADIDTCEVEAADGWARIGIEDALTRRPKPMRCPACHGEVRAHKEGTKGSRAHFEHLRGHDGCPVKNGFSGVASPHPDALE